MKKSIFSILAILGMVLFTSFGVMSCDVGEPDNHTAFEEQAMVEQNQSHLNNIQPSPQIDWSLERDNLTKRTKLQNDRAVVFYLYVFNFGSNVPLGYYQVNKVSSVNSQLTNPNQLVEDPYAYGEHSGQILPSPAEDGSYGTNGDAVFGFTPDDIYIEHNMQYICSTVPLNFNAPKLVDISVADAAELAKLMNKLQ
jgi:hypothetical protein